MKNLQGDLEAMLESMHFGGQQDPREQRIIDIKNKLHTDAAHKECQQLLDFVDTITGPSHGKLEAIGFIKVYLHRVLSLPALIAEEMHLLQEVVIILTEKCLPAVMKATQETVQKFKEDPHYSKWLAGVSAPFEALSEDQITTLNEEQDALSAELELERQQEKQDDRSEPRARSDRRN